VNTSKRDTKVPDNDNLLQIEVENLLRIYESIGSILKDDVGNPIFQRLVESWSLSRSQLKERLASSSTSSELKAIIRGLREGLRDLPKIISSVEKEGSSELVSKIEKETGIKLSDV